MVCFELTQLTVFVLHVIILCERFAYWANSLSHPHIETPCAVCPPIPVGSFSFYVRSLSVSTKAQPLLFPNMCVSVCTGLCEHCYIPTYCLTPLFLSPLSPLSHFLSPPTLFLSPLTVSIELLCCVQSYAVLIYLNPDPSPPGASLVVFVFVLIVAGPPHV